MIDNHFEAWDQQFGLSQAKIVYSTLVEGGTTRFMALFDVNNTNTKIGPVRSVRPYFIHWILEYNALLTHVGGSPEALQDIIDFNVNDFNEMTSYGSLYFARDNNYKAPHSTFISTKKLQKALQQRHLESSYDFVNDHFSFGKNENYPNSQSAKELYIDYSAKQTYDVKYIWQPDLDGYIRYRVGDAQRDAETGDVILIKNIIVQKVPAEVVLDKKLRIAMDIEGSGDAYIFMNGKVINGTWEKKAMNLPTKFFDTEGNEIVLGQGNVWIEIVPEGHKVVF